MVTVLGPDGQPIISIGAGGGRFRLTRSAIMRAEKGHGLLRMWKRTGGELFYRNGDSMMAVPVSPGPSFANGRPRELWKGHYSHGMSSSCGPAGLTSSNYDVTLDGERFLMIKDDDQDSATSRQVVVVLGWTDELNRMSKA